MTKMNPFGVATKSQGVCMSRLRIRPLNHSKARLSEPRITRARARTWMRREANHQCRRLKQPAVTSVACPNICIRFGGALSSECQAGSIKETKVCLLLSSDAFGDRGAQKKGSIEGQVVRVGEGALGAPTSLAISRCIMTSKSSARPKSSALEQCLSSCLASHRTASGKELSLEILSRKSPVSITLRVRS